MTLRLHQALPAAGAAALLGMSANPDDVAAQSAQAAYTYPDGTPHPTTPWGDPDLRGKWPIMQVFTTPLQRDPGHGERRLLEDEERAERQEILARRDAACDAENESNRIGMGHWAESTTGMKVTERIMRIGDERIDYEMTIEEPEVLADKWTVSYPMFIDPEYELFEYAYRGDNTAVVAH